MSKRFKIVITEQVVEAKIGGREWRQGVDLDNGKDGYGYTPEIEKQVEVEREIYKQNTDELDLVEVIKAINSI